MFTPPLGQTGRRRRYVLDLSVRPSVCPSVRSFVYYQIFEHDIVKTNEQITMTVGISGPRAEGMTRSTSLTFEVTRRRPKINVTRGRKYSASQKTEPLQLNNMT